MGIFLVWVGNVMDGRMDAQFFRGHTYLYSIHKVGLETNAGEQALTHDAQAPPAAMRQPAAAMTAPGPVRTPRAPPAKHILIQEKVSSRIIIIKIKRY